MMTLTEAHNCLSRRPEKGCKGCPFEETSKDCFSEALQIGATAIQYLQVGRKLIIEAEGKEKQ